MSKKLLFNFNREVIQNYTYVKYVGTIITATNTLEKPIKSAILKGQTLVNLVPQNSGSFNGTRFLRIPLNSIVKANTSYFVKFNLIESSLTNGVTCRFKNTTTGRTMGGLKSDGIITVDGDGYNIIEFYITNANDVTNGLDAIVDDIMVIEYEDSMENWDIPYFTGMTSCKMPVLTTTGKNTLNPNEITFDSSSATNPESYTYSEGVYTFKNSRSNNQMRFGITKQNASDKILCEVLEVKDLNGNVTPHQIAMESSNDKKYWFSIVRPDWGNVGEVKIKLGVDSLEPYKSNILTTPQDVVLRGVGKIKDELNVATGELTQRIGEIVLNGSENWNKYNVYTQEGYTAFITTIETLNNLYHNTDINFISADFPTGTWHDYRNNLISEFVWNHDPNKIGIRVKNEIATNVDGIKAFLSANNIKINYKLATSVVKTVDLSILDQNENKVSSISSFNDTTHITASSETIPPIFEGYLATKEVE